MNDQSRRKPAIDPFWSIWFPLGFVLFAVLVVVILLIIGTVSNSAVSTLWAQISTIFLIIPAMIIGIILFLFLVLSIRGMSNLIPKISPFMAKASEISSKVNRYSGVFSKVVTTPVVWIEHGFAFVQTAWKKYKPFIMNFLRSKSKGK